MSEKRMPKEALEQQITAFLGKPFTYLSCGDDPDLASCTQVNGTIPRHGKTANVAVSLSREDNTPKYWKITDEEITMPAQRIGSIQLGKNVCVTDPCYTRDVWCMTQLEDVKPGRWDVYVCIDEIDTWGKRVYVLELFHRDVEQPEEQPWKERAVLGVDSGQMSVFDDAYYRRKDGSEEAFQADTVLRESFYDTCCGLSSERAGIFRAGNKPVGVVCSSGCGDGSYPLYTREVDGEIVAMRLSFM